MFKVVLSLFNRVMFENLIFEITDFVNNRVEEFYALLEFGVTGIIRIRRIMLRTINT
jgi:hypothetical protein